MIGQASRASRPLPLAVLVKSSMHHASSRSLHTTICLLEEQIIMLAQRISQHSARRRKSTCSLRVEVIEMDQWLTNTQSSPNHPPFPDSRRQQPLQPVNCDLKPGRSLQILSCTCPSLPAPFYVGKASPRQLTPLLQGMSPSNPRPRNPTHKRSPQSLPTHTPSSLPNA